MRNLKCYRCGLWFHDDEATLHEGITGHKVVDINIEQSASVTNGPRYIAVSYTHLRAHET